MFKTTDNVDLENDSGTNAEKWLKLKYLFTDQVVFIHKIDGGSIDF